MYRIGQQELDEIAKVFAAKRLSRVWDDEDRSFMFRFEKEWAQIIGVKHALHMAGGGTAALTCALVGLGIGPGDEVIVPAYTWLASAACALCAGAIPVLADVDETLSLDPADFERKITPNTRAVIPVHMAGRPADLSSILAIAKKHGISVVEDCCQACGGSYRGKRLGSWGHAGTFSFNQYKILSCGEGGALVTDDRLIYDRAFVYHDVGASCRPNADSYTEPIYIGQQLRATEITAAILRVQASRLEGILADLRRIRCQFQAELDGEYGLRITPSNDQAGDCAVVAAFQFDSEEKARAFSSAPGVDGYLPIDSGKHVYTNWGPILEKRCGHRPEVSPFNHPKNQGLRMNYTNEMCERTLDYLRRNVLIAIDPDWTDREVRDRIDACKKASQ